MFFYFDNRIDIYNVIFLLSGCFYDDDLILEFIGENLFFFGIVEGFKSILMFLVLYKEFEERCICLYWVNISNY